MAKKATAAKLADWRTLDAWIEGEPVAADGLLKSRRHLEGVVAPYVSTKKTGAIINYCGKRRYLKDCPALVTHAMRALQFLYGIEAAMQEGDIDKAVRMTMGYAAEKDNTTDMQMWDTTGLAAITTAKTARRKGGQGSRKWTPDIEARALELAAKIPNEKCGERNRTIAERLSRDCGKQITASLVRKYLTPLLKNAQR